jgi:hypothetical protein
MAATTLAITDANAASKTLSVNADASNSVTTALMGKTSVSDPTSGIEQNVRADGRAYVSTEGGRNTYRYVVPAFTPVATPTTMVQVTGSATKTISVKRIRVDLTGTAAGKVNIAWRRRSTAGATGATETAITPLKHSGSTAATAAVVAISVANYTTPGTVVAVGGACYLGLTASGAVSFIEWIFGDKGEAALVLSGVSDFLTIDGEGSTVPTTGTLNIEIVTTEW